MGVTTTPGPAAIDLEAVVGERPLVRQGAWYSVPQLDNEQALAGTMINAPFAEGVKKSRK